MTTPFYVLVTKDNAAAPNGYHPYGSAETLRALYATLPNQQDVSFFRVNTPVANFEPAPKGIDDVNEAWVHANKRLDDTVAAASAAAAERLAPLKDSSKPAKERLFGALRNFGLPTSVKELQTNLEDFGKRAGASVETAVNTLDKKIGEAATRVSDAADTVQKAGKGDADAKAKVSSVFGDLSSRVSGALKDIGDTVAGKRPDAIITDKGQMLVSSAWLVVPGNAVQMAGAEGILYAAPAAAPEARPSM